MDQHSCQQYVSELWDKTITPALIDYIRIPNKSPVFDPEWKKNGYMDEAVTLITQWCQTHALPDMTLEVLCLPNRTPLIYIDIPGESDDTILLYGHLDKQPEMTGWDDDLGPWKPVLKGERLYGRGGADDGYAAFASLTAIKVLREQKIPHARCVILIEASEESGSPDLPAYMDALKDKIGEPSLIICLDSGAGNYDQLWVTTSLRGNIVGKLSVDLISEGVHSGNASGIVPDSFRVVRQLLDRIENPETGEIILSELHAKIPKERIEQASVAAQTLGEHVFSEFPFLPDVQAVTEEPAQLILNRTWRPALTVTGAEGLPAIRDAGNVCRPNTTLKLSMRIPPTSVPERATKIMKKTLEASAPYQAKVHYESGEGAAGWDAPPVAEWLAASLAKASEHYFGKEAVYMGEGGSIPFMGMLGEQFPQAQFVITGVLGPHSNAHGPNEFLDIPMAKKVTCCVAEVIADHFQS